jgi:hypothetical protein
MLPGSRFARILMIGVAVVVILGLVLSTFASPVIY